MNFIGKLFFRNKVNGPAGSRTIVEAQPGRGYKQDIVGESQYQSNLLKIAGPKEEYQKNFRCTANLMHETSNQYDPNAIAVGIEGRLVGYLARSDAKAFLEQTRKLGISTYTISCPAKIIGGWAHENGEGDFGVRLKLSWPIKLKSTKTG